MAWKRADITDEMIVAEYVPKGAPTAWHRVAPSTVIKGDV